MAVDPGDGPNCALWLFRTGVDVRTISCRGVRSSEVSVDATRCMAVDFSSFFGVEKSDFVLVSGTGELWVIGSFGVLGLMGLAASLAVVVSFCFFTKISLCSSAGRFFSGFEGSTLAVTVFEATLGFFSSDTTAGFLARGVNLRRFSIRFRFFFPYFRTMICRWRGLGLAVRPLARGVVVALLAVAERDLSAGDGSLGMPKADFADN